MKKKVLSLLLAVCLIVGMLPLAASAAGEPFQVDGAGYNTLAEALTHAGEAGTVEAVGTYTVSGDDATALGTAKTNIVVKSTGNITVEAKNFEKLVGYQGSITVEAGGVLQLPNDESGTEAWFGGVDARMKITAGSITISGLNNFTSGGCVWKLSSGAQVEVPTGKEAFLHVGAGPATYGVQLVIPAEASMSVSGTLKAVKKNMGAQVDLDGTLTINQGGKMEVAQDAKVSVGPKAEIQVAGGALTVYDKTSVVGEADSSKVVLSQSGTFETSGGDGIVTGDNTYVWSYLNPDNFGATIADGAWKSELEDLVITTEYWQKQVEATQSGDTYAPTWEALRNLTFFYNIAKGADSQNTYQVRLEAVNTFITTTLTKLDMSEEAITSAGGASDNTGILAGYTGLTWLNLSNTGITEIGGVSKLTSLTYLDVSQNPDLTAEDFGALNGLDSLKELNLSGTSIEDVGGLVANEVADTIETLNISDTKVTKLESVWDASGSKSAFPKLKNLTAKNLELTSISGLAEIASADGFDSTGITWDLSGSELTDTPDNKAHIDRVKEKFTATGTFNAPTVPGSSTGGGSTGGGSTGGGSTGGGTSSGTTYDNTVAATTNGKVTVTDAKKGETATITTTPDKGYKVGTVTAKDEKGNNVPVSNAGNGKYTFTQPEGKVTVTVTFVWDNPFKDVKSGDWWYNAVQYVHLNGLMAGTGTTTFSPTATLTRAQAVQVLYNLEGQPTVTGKNTFTDVASNHWGIKAITWASENGVVAGVGNNKFDPDVNVSREQFAQMMYNYATYKKYNTSASADLTKFPDDDTVSSWATKALAWANAEGLINGTEEDGTVILAPNGTANRAQAASILMNFDKNVVM